MSEQAPNKPRNEGGSVTVALPKYELVRWDGKVIAQCWSIGEGAAIAKILWPDQEQDEDRTGKGWDVQVCGV